MEPIVVVVEMYDQHIGIETIEVVTSLDELIELAIQYDMCNVDINYDLHYFVGVQNAEDKVAAMKGRFHNGQGYQFMTDHKAQQIEVPNEVLWGDDEDCSKLREFMAQYFN